MSRRILWLVKGLGRGGAERLITLMAPRIARRGYEVDVAYLLPWDDDLVPDIQQAGLTTSCLEARRTVDTRWVSHLRRLLRDGKYDLIHTHSPVPAVAARVLRRHGTPIVHTEHNVWERYRWPTYAANAATFGRNVAAIAVSDGVADSIAAPRWLPTARYPRVQTLRHGIDVDEARVGSVARASARERLGIGQQAPVIGNVANLTPKKDHATLIEAIDRLRQKHEGLIAVIVGDGPLKSDLKDDVARRRLEASVRFLGTRGDVLDLLPALDVFVLSSRFEGLPISMLEAMASEVACVLTRVGGIPEAVAEGKDAVLVLPGDPESLTEALHGLLSDDELRRQIGRRARQRVCRDFSIDRAVQEHVDLYDAVLGGTDPFSCGGT